MALKDIFSINNFLIQYLVIYVLIAYISLNYSFFSFITTLSHLIIVLFISWHLFKRIRKKFYCGWITSYKRAVLITGCDSGLGNGLAFKLNQNGFRVYATVLDQNSSGAQDLEKSCIFQNKINVIRMNVTNDEEVERVYQKVKKDLKENGEELWAVVNNAGIASYGPIDWGSIESFNQVFDVNTFGTVRVSRTFLPLIRKSKGRIVNIASIAGRFTFPRTGIYSMSKHSVISFSDALRRENKKWGVKVSTICPMGFKTPMASPELQRRSIEKEWNESSEYIKQVYGQKYYEYIKSNSLAEEFNIPVSTNISKVIDKMVDSVCNSEPEITYTVSGTLSEKLSFFTLLLLPTEISDYIMCSLESKSNQLIDVNN